MTYIEPTSLPTYLHPLPSYSQGIQWGKKATEDIVLRDTEWRITTGRNLESVCVRARSSYLMWQSMKNHPPFSPSLGASSTVTREKLIMLKLLTAAKSRCSALLCPTPNLLLQLPASTVSGPSVMAPSPRWPVDRLSLVVCWQRNPGAWGRHASQDFPGDSYAPPSFVGGESHPLTLTR